MDKTHSVVKRQWNKTHSVEQKGCLNRLKVLCRQISFKSHEILKLACSLSRQLFKVICGFFSISHACPERLQMALGQSCWRDVTMNKYCCGCYHEPNIVADIQSFQWLKAFNSEDFTGCDPSHTTNTENQKLGKLGESHMPGNMRNFPIQASVAQTNSPEDHLWGSTLFTRRGRDTSIELFISPSVQIRQE